MEDTSPNRILRISNSLNLTKQEFTTNEKKIFACVIHSIKNRQAFNIDNHLEALEVEFPSSLIDETNLKRIDEALDKLTSRKLKFNLQNQDLDLLFGNLPYFSYAVYERRKGAHGNIRVDINGRVKKIFLELAQGYSEIELKAVMSLSSAHTIRLYELLSQYKNKGYWLVSIDELKQLMGIDLGSYKNFALFENRILEYAQKELWEHCDLDFTWEVAEKQKKKVLGLRFMIQDRKKQERNLLNNEIRETQDYVATMDGMQLAIASQKVLSKYNLSGKQMEHLLADRIMFNEFVRIDLIIEDMIANKKGPKDRTKYLAKSLGLDKMKFK